MVCCPITTQLKNYPFEVLIAGSPPSAALADQLKSVDWRSRQAMGKSVASPEELAAVRSKVLALIGGK